MNALANLDIRSLREKLKMSQETLAHRLGVSLFTVYRWEKGKSHPNSLARRELAVYLYSQNIIPFGKAREISGLSKTEFLTILAERNIPNHYNENDLKDDLEFIKQWK